MDQRLDVSSYFYDYAVSINEAYANLLRAPDYHWPQDELKDRLNKRLRGVDPGLPICWRGLK